MEGDNGGTTGSSRWNPTKEQINMLENLYKQGVRTPSANQIQHITGRLRAYGHIEGKNVFYWFQNHKARQRQKQKQQSMAYFNRLLHKTTRFLYPPPCSNVACGPYYLQEGDSGTPYPQCHQDLLAGGYRKRPSTGLRAEKATKMDCTGGFDQFAHQDLRNITLPVIGKASEGANRSFHHDHDGITDDVNQKTLPLFPLQPTSVSQGNAASLLEIPDSWPTSSLSEAASYCQPFFDFFSGSCESESVLEWKQ